MDNVNAVAYATKSLLSGKIELCQMLPIAFEEDLTSTLNYKHGVFANTRPETIPKVKYFGIGIGGRYLVDDAALTSAYKPAIDDMDLYMPIPFRLVPIDEDLSSAERANYRMRVRKTINGVEYYAYYLKLIEYSEGLKFTRINPATQEEEPYELDPTNLTPIGKKPSTSGTTNATIQEIKASVKAQITFTGAEVVEAINILFKGDLRYAVISEIGLYMGEDKVVSGVTPAGTNISYNESIYTQLVIKNTFNGTDMSQNGSVEKRDIVFTSGTPMILLG